MSEPEPLDIDGILGGPLTVEKAAELVGADVELWEERFSSPASLGAWAAEHTGLTWRRAKHLDFIDQELVRCMDEDLRLIVSTPPQHGKSSLISQWLPVWYLSIFPERPILHVSYAGDFAVQNGSERVRDRILELGDSLGVTIENGHAAPKSGWRTRALDPETGRWKKTEEGGMHSVGIGGPITGKPAKLILVDDPLKDHAESLSETIKKSHRDWWDSTLSTRIRPGTSCIVVATRWAEDDIPGHLIAQSKAGKGDVWRVINLPALAFEKDDPLERKMGDALWEEVVGRAWLEKHRAGILAYWWWALYQGQPRAPDGQVFRRPFKYCEVIGDFVHIGTEKWNIRSELRYVMAADTAMKVARQNDSTAIVTMAITPRGEFIIWDVTCKKLEVPDQWPAIKAAIERRRPARVGIEAKASGIGLIQQAEREYRAGTLRVKVDALSAEVDKMQRAAPLSIAYQGGRVWHRAGTDWLDDTEHEMLGFPAAAYDDRVDALAHAYGLAVTLAARPPINIEDYVVGGARRKPP